MCTTPVLAMLEFDKTFVLECDASSIDLRVVLMKERHPLASTSKELCNHNLRKSTYDKEMMAILYAIETWNSYLVVKNFQIKTNNHSLKYFLEQQLYSPKQHKWINKMLRNDYEITYKKGKENVFADALSIQFEEDGSLLSLSLPSPIWIE